ncbi:MAG: biotin transporter BioY [Spirochaetales bacterium]|nr:MAG: biotin transporter BioY [Spirochaetales bacterium]
MSLRYSIFAALFTALYIAGTFVRIPVGPVPIVLTNMFIFLGGLVLPLPWAAASVLLYLLLGTAGLPVFSGGGGPAYFAGPTGGYLIGYLAAVCAVSLVSRIGKRKLPVIIISLAVGIIIIYALGLPWLKFKLDLSWRKALPAGLLPFIPGDVIKAAAAFGAFIIYRRVASHAAS